MIGTNKETIWIWISGVGAGFLGMLCCIGPIAALFLGIGGASVLLGLDQYRPVFTGLGLLVLAGVSWYAVSHRRQCCNTRSRVKEIQLVFLIVGAGISAYVVLQYGIMPALSKVISQQMNAEAKMEVSTLPEKMEGVSLEIEGMTCAGCAVGVQKALLDIHGIVTAEVDWKTGKAKIQYDVETIKFEDMKKIDLPPPYILKTSETQ